MINVKFTLWPLWDYSNWFLQVVKYGVVRMKLLYEDLVNWDRLYVAGRMQKPVLTLQSNQTIEDANYRNRVSSLVASLLMLPEKFKSQVRMIWVFRL